jgi:hypothetical protein
VWNDFGIVIRHVERAAVRAEHNAVGSALLNPSGGDDPFSATTGFQLLDHRFSLPGSCQQLAIGADCRR